MHAIVAFPWSRKKEVVNHPEQIAAGGIWSIVHAMRMLGDTVTTVNLYDEKDSFNDVQALMQYEDAQKNALIDFVFVFDFGNSRVDWGAARKRKETLIVYHAGDDPMRFDANCDTIEKGNFDVVLTAQKNSIQKYAEKFPRLSSDLAWIPYWYDPLLHREIYGQEKMFDVIHCGKIYGLRERILKKISEKYSVKHEFQFGHAYTSTLSKSRIGLHHAWCGEVGYRHFEIPAMGLPLVCDRLDESFGLSELLPEEYMYVYEGKNDDEKVQSCFEMIEKVLRIDRTIVKRNCEELKKHVSTYSSVFSRVKEIYLKCGVV